ncbi:DUF4426 domain-containing protein [Kangiella sp. HZ709]|uniref:DUF4426 domain-containing protein n=1 Tax=Kangiella sp. HZ709 TaxID=2666328 RepID=UPI0012AFD705|nr:DUF4426 domain-containing protein [Kangiella sp. HZ709]MRX28106.1 DUF4426 domain-containing protein [Kangiella sp. HZ709]
MKYSLVAILLTVSTVFPFSLAAEEKRVGDHIIYYNAFNSSFLQPEVATAYKIQRTSFTGVLNISIHNANKKGLPDAIAANVQGRIRNQLSQNQELSFREIKEENAIYYLADFQFRPREETDIRFIVRIPGISEPIEIEFDQKFYKD